MIQVLKTKKNIILFISLLSLNCCMQSSAMLGPAVTIGTTGNVYHGGLSYTSNKLIQKETGQNTLQHIADLLEPKQKKIDKNFIKLVTENINNTRKKLNLNKKD